MTYLGALHGSASPHAWPNSFLWDVMGEAHSGWGCQVEGQARVRPLRPCRCWMQPSIGRLMHFLWWLKRMMCPLQRRLMCCGTRWKTYIWPRRDNACTPCCTDPLQGGSVVGADVPEDGDTGWWCRRWAPYFTLPLGKETGICRCYGCASFTGSVPVLEVICTHCTRLTASHSFFSSFFQSLAVLWVHLYYDL